MGKEEVQLTVRFAPGTHRKMKFISVSTGESMNDMVNRAVLQALEGVHIDVPKDLLVPEEH